MQGRKNDVTRPFHREEYVSYLVGNRIDSGSCKMGGGMRTAEAGYSPARHCVPVRCPKSDHRRHKVDPIGVWNSHGK